MTFEPFSVSALREALPYIRKNRSLCSDISAGYLFMWQKGTDVGFCVRNGTLVVRQMIGEQPAFSYPIGDDPDGMIDELKVYVKENGLPLRFFAVDDELFEKIRADERLKSAMWAYDRRWSDYIYLFDEALTFAGKKYSGQRNHINKFKKLYGEPVMRFLTPSDGPEVKAMLNEYAAAHRDGRALERAELEKTGELFDVSDLLGLYSAGLFVEGKLAALCIGEVTGDMLMIHVEKALAKYEGIYPTVYSNFVRLISEHSDCPLRYINREDDSGDPGLRTSKLQYHPVAMANKHLVHVASPAAKAGPAAAVSRGSIVLTEIRESDKPAYLALNTDTENNRYWGYDYREDIGITGQVDENTFYDSVQLDMQAGDSVNFAVRLSERGEMIGEVIIWNFTANGTAELGCRILREYQGKGCGRDAFGAGAEFAARTLGVKVIARCFRENTASYRMIAANGFVPLREDSEFYYFERPAAGRGQ